MRTATSSVGLTIITARPHCSRWLPSRSWLPARTVFDGRLYIHRTSLVVRLTPDFQTSIYARFAGVLHIEYQEAMILKDSVNISEVYGITSSPSNLSEIAFSRLDKS
ncbi:hypothetical protein Y032_0180g795 [Ancylostoma ceylanicum]|uniref:Uncharacterized protein n=1 Tax=Ancylostoma ceylanicum TaxID=53326 RepID=A0A016SSW6_9BILA|nr:hypothetical protein Y032_0180g795 [Ancylostoma ceylanicum]